MAKLSNINGKFAVEDTGAIRFSDQTGTTGQILKSNGNSAPTWVDPNTVGTGPWLPLAGGVVSGPTTFQSSLTVGGLLTGANATFNGLMKLDAGGILQFAANTATPSMGVAIHRSAADTLNFVTASTNRLTIDDDGNVGIGIDTPTLVAGKIVHIHGVAAGVHLTDTASGTTSGDGGYVAFDNPNLYIQNKEAGSMFFETSGTTALTIDSDQDATFAGVIGVNGSTNANIPITATTSSGYEDVAYFKSAGTNINSRISLFPTGTGDGVVNSTANDLILQTGGADRVTITDTNSTFAGTVTTTQINLNSSGGGIIDNQTGNIFIQTPSGTGWIFRNGASGYDEKMRIDSSGNVGIGVTPFAHTLSTSASLDLKGFGGIWGYAGATYVNSNAYYDSGWKYKTTAPAAVLQVGGSSQELTFRQAVSGTAGNAITYTQPFTIDTSGNVGIGRTAPDYKLVISNNNAEGIEFGPGYISGCNLWQNYNRTTSTYVKETHYGSEYHFLPAGGATGNVGINTNSPSEKLSVVGGNIRLESTVAGSNGVLIIYDSNTTQSGQIYGSSGDLKIYSPADVLFNQAGNVGIGTNSPDAKLMVKDSSDSGFDSGIAIIRSANSQTGYINMVGGAMNFNSPSIPIIFRQSGTERMRISGSGATTLTLGQSGEIPEIKAGGTNTDLRLSAVGPGGFLDFQTNATPRMRITSGGTVFIDKDTAGIANDGIELKPFGQSNFTCTGGEGINVNRKGSDGNLMRFYNDSVEAGTISVSGGTVSYNGFAGCHESSGINSDVAIGTVVSTIDELDTRVVDEEIEDIKDHAKIKISDEIGDKRVYGVLQTYSEENDKPKIASVGIGSILVTGSCEGGDLLVSNGDGTAKVQDDDIVRSKTIGKVTIGNTDTEVKLVSCVLYCG
jgi:hypothetical protein